jgi:adenylate cyclase
MMVAMAHDPAIPATNPDAGVALAEGRDVHAFLIQAGVSEAEIDEATATGTLPVLVLDVIMFPSRPKYDEKELVEIVGVDPAYAKTLWRAMGFPTLPEGEVAFNDDDLIALRSALNEGDMPEAYRSTEPLEGSVVRQTRVISAAMARVAEQTTESFANLLSAMRERNLSDDEICQTLITTFKIEEFERLLWYMFRRQWRAAVWRGLARPATGGDVAVGFVDLVRFSAITEQVADEELEQLIVRFDEVARDAIAEGGGRVVKMIGDAVMFVADTAESATLIALDLVEAYANDPLLPPARAGLSIGPVLARDGDYYGPVVNLAARIVDVARASRVVISDAMHDELTSSDGLRFHRLPPKRLKGIGRSQLWAVEATRPARRTMEPRVSDSAPSPR